MAKDGNMCTKSQSVGHLNRICGQIGIMLDDTFDIYVYALGDAALRSILLVLC